jgi:hypothetical protein
MNLYLAQALAKWKEQKLPMLPLWNGRNYFYSLQICKSGDHIVSPEQSTEELMHFEKFFLLLTLRQVL